MNVCRRDDCGEDEPLIGDEPVGRRQRVVDVVQHIDKSQECDPRMRVTLDSSRSHSAFQGKGF
jgi:hypothetical protein